MKKKTCPPLTADSLYAWCMFVCKVKIGFGIQVCSVTKPFRLLPPLSLSRGTCQHGPRLLDACVQMRTQRQLGALQCRLSLHVFSAFAFGVDIFNIIFHLILLYYPLSFGSLDLCVPTYRMCTLAWYSVYFLVVCRVCFLVYVWAVDVQSVKEIPCEEEGGRWMKSRIICE